MGLVLFIIFSQTLQMTNSITMELFSIFWSQINDYWNNHHQAVCYHKRVRLKSVLFTKDSFEEKSFLLSVKKSVSVILSIVGGILTIFELVCYIILYSYIKKHNDTVAIKVVDQVRLVYVVKVNISLVKVKIRLVKVKARLVKGKTRLVKVR